MKYLIYQSKNQLQMKKVITHPEIFKYIIDVVPDGTINFKLNALLHKDLTVYMMRVDHELAGIALFNKKNNISIIDFGFIPKFRGKHAKNLAKLVLDEYNLHNKDISVEGKIRPHNKRSLMFALWMGFEIVSKSDDYYYVRQVRDGK